MRPTSHFDRKLNKWVPYVSSPLSKGVQIMGDPSGGTEHLDPFKTVTWSGRRKKRELLRRYDAVDYEKGMDKGRKVRTPDPMVTTTLRTIKDPEVRHKQLEETWGRYHRGA